MYDFGSEHRKVLLGHQLDNKKFESSIWPLVKKISIINECEAGRYDAVEKIIKYYKVKVAVEEFYGLMSLQTFKSFGLLSRNLSKAVNSDIDMHISDLSDLSEEEIGAIILDITKPNKYAPVQVMKEVRRAWQELQVVDRVDRLEGRVIICDGAMGTLLIDGGLDVGPASWWNKECGDKVQEIHEGYVEAGAQIISTNTLDANRKKLTRYQKQKYVEELNYLGVEIARRARAGGDVLIVGEVGPSGCDEELFSSNGDEGGIKDDLYHVFEEQAVTLCEAGVDSIWIEGMTYLREAVIAVEAARNNTNVPVVCSMQFAPRSEVRPGEFRTLLWGDSVSDVVRELKEAGAHMVGANCGRVVEQMPQLALEIREKTDLPLVFELSAGLPEFVKKEKGCGAEYGLGFEEFAEITLRVAEEGGNIIGGCCGTTPEHIAAVRRRLRGNGEDRGAH